MDEMRVTTRRRGFFTRVDALESGYADRDLTAAVRGGVVTRFRRGSYSFADDWRRWDDTARHLVRVAAVTHSLGPSVVVSHTSAVLLHGVATYGADLSRVHVTRRDGGPGRIERDVVHHEGVIAEDQVTAVRGHPVVEPVRAAIETATLLRPEGALVVFDSLLHRELATHPELAAAFERMSSWPRIRHLQIPVRMADPGGESPGESRGRWLFYRNGLPAPVTQYEVRDSNGVLIGRCDWAWPEHGLLGEFDGMVKYGRLLRPGEDVADVVLAEKRREDLLREITGFRMIRLTWPDYDRPQTTVGRLRSMLRLSA